MEIKQLRALKVIAETGSFRQAADILDVTQSALSHQIKQLEDELEETLLIRGRPKVYPSPAGMAVLDSATKILSELQALESRFAESRRGPVKGTLRIAATAMSIVYVIGDLCEAFIRRYPGIELVLTATETADAAQRRVLSGAADVAYGPMPQGQVQFASLVLANTEHAFVVRAGHPLSSQRLVTLEELCRYPVLLFPHGSGTRAMTDEVFSHGGAHPQTLTESNDVQFIKRMVSIGPGFALLPVYALMEEAKRGTLHLLRLASRPLMVGVGFVHRNEVRMNSVELFKALCFEQRGPVPLDIVIENVTAPIFPRLPTFAMAAARPS